MKRINKAQKPKVHGPSTRTSEAAVAAAAEIAAPPAFGWAHLRGHEGTLAALAALYARAALPQVLLLVGRDGIGKRSLAAALAALPFCTDVKRRPCGHCGSCLSVARGRHPEVLCVATDGGTYKVAEAALVQDHLALSPEAGAARVVVLADADAMTVQAANRLLKTLEEPPPSAFIVMTTSRVGAMLVTILSRAVRWRVPPPPLSEGLAVLRDALGDVASTIDESMLVAYLRESGLAPGKALARALAYQRDLTPSSVSRQGSQPAPQAAHCWDALMEDLSSPADVAALTKALTAAEALARGTNQGSNGPSMAALLDEWELAVNAGYHRAFVTDQLGPIGTKGPMSRPSSHVATARRVLASELRRRIQRQRIVLNAQLAWESLALAGVETFTATPSARTESRR